MAVKYEDLVTEARITRVRPYYRRATASGFRAHLSAATVPAMVVSRLGNPDVMEENAYYLRYLQAAPEVADDPDAFYMPDEAVGHLLGELHESECECGTCTRSMGL